MLREKTSFTKLHKLINNERSMNNILNRYYKNILLSIIINRLHFVYYNYCYIIMFKLSYYIIKIIYHNIPILFFIHKLMLF